MRTTLLPANEESGKRIPAKLLCIEELIFYLTKHNDSVMVYVKKIYINAKGNKVYEMSNGFSYIKSGEGEWFII